MPEKDVPKTISRIFGMGRSLRARLPKSLSRKSRAAPWQDWGARLALLLALSLFAGPGCCRPGSRSAAPLPGGDVAQENVKAIGGFLVEDVETTGKKQQDADDADAPGV